MFTSTFVQLSFSFSVLYSFDYLESFFFFLRLSGAKKNIEKCYLSALVIRSHDENGWKTSRNFFRLRADAYISVINITPNVCTLTHPHSTLLNIEMSKFIDSNSFSFFFLFSPFRFCMFDGKTFHQSPKLKVSSRPRLFREKKVGEKQQRANPF